MVLKTHCETVLTNPIPTSKYALTPATPLLQRPLKAAVSKLQ